MGKKEFVKYIRIWMVENDVQQGDLAERAGLHPTSLSRILGDDSMPTIPVVQKLAEAMGVDPLELIAKLLDRPRVWITKEQQDMLLQIAASSLEGKLVPTRQGADSQSTVSEDQLRSLLSLINTLVHEGKLQA